MLLQKVIDKLEALHPGFKAMQVQTNRVAGAEPTVTVELKVDMSTLKKYDFSIRRADGESFNGAMTLIKVG